MIKKNTALLLNNSSILFATFSLWQKNKRTPINGNIEPVRDFLVPRTKKFVIIDQLHPGSDDVMPKIEEYKNHSFKYVLHKSSWFVYCLKPFLWMRNFNGTHISFKIRDFLSVIDWSLRDTTKFDYFIGLEGVNTLAGIFLRRLGRIDKVIYYVFDYSPNRFTNTVFNKIYLFLDRFCATHADYIWDVSKAMQPARISVGLDPRVSAPVIHVPIGIHSNQIQANPISDIEKHSLVYMGTLGPENGPDIAIHAFFLVQKKYPDSALHIIGGNEKDIKELKKLVEKLHIQKGVIFHGMIPSNSDMSKIIRSCSLGLAPYRYIFGSPRLYADSSKIRAYCASGVPTVSSQVPPLGREVAEKGAGVIAMDNPTSFAKSIIEIFDQPSKYRALRKKAIELAKFNTWENSFSNAFTAMNKIYI